MEPEVIIFTGRKRNHTTGRCELADKAEVLAA